jgi:signal transduction histidine kinase
MSGDPGHRYIESIQRSAERMRLMIHDLLDMATMEAGHLRVARRREPAARLVTESVDLMGPLAAEKGVALAREIDDACPEVWGDRERLGQVFSNLIGNAIKFTPAGGRVLVRAAADRDHVRFVVEDDGAGIAEEDLPHIFDRYWKMDRADRSGSGLGLSIARGLVELHGGRITVESTRGKGSRFSVYLPAASD